MSVFAMMIWPAKQFLVFNSRHPERVGRARPAAGMP
jgi:hypothetical protein